MKKQAFNPYLPTYEYVPDGEPRVFGDRLYIFGSHDRAGGTEYCQNDYVCWSASVDSLGEWKYEGCIYRKDQDPRWTGEPYDNLFAPDVVQGVDGRYYLYYFMAGHDSIGVAVCDTPAGQYEFMGYVHDESGVEPGAAEGDWIQADPAVLVDDGKVYLYSGFNPTFPFRPDKTFVGAYVMQLKSDMITMVGERKIIFATKEEQCKGHDYFEASSIRKIEGTYYFVYSSQASHELCYATSKYPDKDFVYGGVLISNVDYGYRGNTYPLSHIGNNHGGMVEINGKWYIFYHRPTNCTMFSRQGSAEQIVINSDGTIDQVEMTSCGLNNGPLAGRGEYEAGIVCNLYNIEEQTPLDMMDREANMERESRLPYLTQDGADREEYPGTYITRMRDGSVAGFKYFELDGAGKISVTVRGNAQGVLYVKTEDDTTVAYIPIASADVWEEIAADMMEIHGVHALRFIFRGEGTIDFMKFYLDL